MSTVNLLAIFAENRTGQLARVTQVLAQGGINIRWASIASGDGFGVIKLLADPTDRAFQCLKKEGLPVSHVEVIALEVEDKPGGLHVVADTLARHQVNIENASAFVVRGRAVLLIEVKAVSEARAILERAQLRLLAEEELAGV